MSESVYGDGRMSRGGSFGVNLVLVGRRGGVVVTLLTVCEFLFHRLRHREMVVLEIFFLFTYTRVRMTCCWTNRNLLDRDDISNLILITPFQDPGV